VGHGRLAREVPPATAATGRRDGRRVMNASSTRPGSTPGPGRWMQDRNDASASEEGTGKCVGDFAVSRLPHGKQAMSIDTARHEEVRRKLAAQARQADPRVEALVNEIIGRVADKWTMIVIDVLAEHAELRFT